MSHETGVLIITVTQVCVTSTADHPLFINPGVAVFWKLDLSPLDHKLISVIGTLVFTELQLHLHSRMASPFEGPSTPKLEGRTSFNLKNLESSEWTENIDQIRVTKLARTVIHLRTTVHLHTSERIVSHRFGSA